MGGTRGQLAALPRLLRLLPAHESLIRLGDAGGPVGSRGMATASFVDRDKWLVRVGLELHAQVNAAEKLFSGASAEYGGLANTQVAAFDAALPGSLPTLNRACAYAAARTGLALGGEVQRRSYFDRKHYYYADLPHGFQITQNKRPVVLGGQLEFDVPPHAASPSSVPTRCKVDIERIQLEVDTGKSTHSGGPAVSPTANEREGTHSVNQTEATQDTSYTLVDLNRAGSALMEIVTRPDMKNGVEAAAFVRELQLLLRHIGSSDGNMEEGSLRVDVNVSVAEIDGTGSPGGRCEVKNLNSLRNVSRAVEAEASRQVALLEQGQTVERETRGFDVSTGETFRLRSKETALDYRFLPEPDLPALCFSESEIENLRLSLNETPEAKVSRLVQQYGIPKKTASTLVSSAGFSDYFETMLANQFAKEVDSKRAANWVVSELNGAIRDARVAIDSLPLSASPVRMVELLALVQSRRISFGMAKDVLPSLVSGDARDIAKIIEEAFGKSEQLTDDDDLKSLCTKVLEDHADEVALFKEGKNKRLMSLFVGKVMKATSGRADAKKVTELLTELIKDKS